MTLIFALKALFFSLAVAVLPMAPLPRYRNGPAGRRLDNIGQLGRMFVVLLAVEVVSLVGNYY